MTKPNAILIGAVCLSLFAAATAGAAMWKVTSLQSASDAAATASDMALTQLSRVKPWAFSRDELTTAIQDSKIIRVTGGLDPNQSSAEQNIVELKDRRYGDPAAQFTLTEYSDFECSFCKTYYQVPKTLVDGSRGNISLVFKHVPIHGEASRKEAFAAECAAHQGGNDAFFKMAELIFEKTKSNGNGTREPLAKLATDIGLDGQVLAGCIDEDMYFEKVKSDFKEAVDLGVKVTPTTVVRHNPSGKEVTVVGAVTPNDLLKAMSQLVQK